MSDTTAATIRGAMVGGILLGASVLAAVVQRVGHALFPLDGSGDELSRNIHLGGMVGSAGTSMAAALVVLVLLVWPWFRPTRKERRLIVGTAVAASVLGTFVMTGLAVLAAGAALAILYAFATADLLPYDAKLGSRLGVALGSIGGLLVASTIPALLLESFLHGVLAGAAAGFLATLAIGNLVLKVLLHKRDTEETARI